MSTVPPIAPAPGAAAPPRPSARPVRILLVEDSIDDALLLRRHLTKAGFAPDVHRVETAEKMIAALHEPWDCILADYNLPQFSAPEALKVLQSTGEDIPFIMMSGAVSEETAVAAMRAGAHDYISKENLARLGPALERELTEAGSRKLKRAAEQALRSSEERFHRLVEASPLALLILDMQGRVTFSNRGASRLLGHARLKGEVGGLQIADVFAAGDFGELDEGSDPHRHVAAGIHSRVDGEHDETWEALCCHADGSRIPVLIGAAVLNPEAPFEDRLLAVYFVDLSEQKRGEEVLRRTEKLAAAGRLAASIAHEINNPLEAITNCLYLLEQSGLDMDARTYLGMAQRELDRVTHITTQTLRFYRQSTKPIATDLPELIQSVLVLYEARIRDHGVEVACDFGNTPQLLAFDGEIRQVLANLVGNAIDAMIGKQGARGLLLRTRAGHVWPGGEPGVAIVVVDQGTGIPGSVLRRIFEPFFSTKGITGTGLGLWVSHEIVEKHGGSLRVRTREGVGTAFRITLPLASEPRGRTPESGLPILS